MEELDPRLVNKGMDEPREGLCDEAFAHVGLGRKLEADLGACGWTPANTAEVETLAMSLGSRDAARAEAVVTAKNTTEKERAERAKAKRLVGKVRIAGALALAETSLPNVSRDSFEAGHSLGQSTPKIVAFMQKILPAVTALDERMRPYFGGESPAALVSQSLQGLIDAQISQESEGATATLETKRVYETKGRLLERIEAMNKVAKIAFYDRSDVAGLFNKDVLNRARAKKADAASDIATAK
jgi:hypothetical protein